MVGFGGSGGSGEAWGKEKFCAEEALVEECETCAEEVGFRRCRREVGGFGSSGRLAM